MELQNFQWMFNNSADYETKLKKEENKVKVKTQFELTKAISFPKGRGRDKKQQRSTSQI